MNCGRAISDGVISDGVISDGAIYVIVLYQATLHWITTARNKSNSAPDVVRFERNPPGTYDFISKFNGIILNLFTYDYLLRILFGLYLLRTNI